jgi:hypothetical protein
VTIDKPRRVTRAIRISRQCDGRFGARRVSRLRCVSESVRLLAAKSEHGYTDDPTKALVDEPEAVSPSYQRYLTREAERRRRVVLLEVWIGCRRRIDEELSVLAATKFDVDVTGDIRAMRGTLERADRRLRAGV